MSCMAANISALVWPDNDRTGQRSLSTAGVDQQSPNHVAVLGSSFKHWLTWSVLVIVASFSGMMDERERLTHKVRVEGADVT